MYSGTKTFSRSSIATYQSAPANAGTAQFIAQVSSNAGPRVEDRGGPEGDTVLLECGTATQYLTWTEDLTKWSTATTASASDSGTMAPDGGNDATKVTFAGGTGNEDLYTSNDLSSFGNNQRVRFSCWARVTTGTGKIQLAIRQRDGSTWASTGDLTVTTTWQRFQLVASTGTSGSPATIRAAILNGSDKAARDVLVWGANLADESAARSNSYFPQSGTFAAESLTFTTAGTHYPASVLSRGFWIQVWPFRSSAEMVARGNGSTEVVAGFGGAASHYLCFIVSSGSVIVRAVESSSARVESSAITFSGDQQISICVEPSAGRLTLRGCTTGDGVFTGTAWTWPTGLLAIGGRAGGSSLGCGGRYYPYLVSV